MSASVSEVLERVRPQDIHEARRHGPRRTLRVGSGCSGSLNWKTWIEPPPCIARLSTMPYPPLRASHARRGSMVLPGACLRGLPSLGLVRRSGPGRHHRISARVDRSTLRSAVIARPRHRHRVAYVCAEQISCLSLWTFQRNAAARRFYERRGFTLVEETDGSRNMEKEPDALYAGRRVPELDTNVALGEQGAPALHEDGEGHRVWITPPSSSSMWMRMISSNELSATKPSARALAALKRCGQPSTMRITNGSGSRRMRATTLSPAIRRSASI